MSSRSVVVRMVDLIAARDQSGWALLRSVSTPVMCGATIDVPDITTKRDDRSFSNPTVDADVDMMFNPGARMSGFSRSQFNCSPLLEKEVTI